MDFSIVRSIVHEEIGRLQAGRSICYLCIPILGFLGIAITTGVHGLGSFEWLSFTSLRPPSAPDPVASQVPAAARPRDTGPSVRGAREDVSTFNRATGLQVSDLNCPHRRCSSSEYKQFVDHLADTLVMVRRTTMQSLPRLHSLRYDLEDMIDRGIRGDIYETGIKFGGTSLFIVAVVEAYERRFGIASTRSYFFWDSFEGFRPYSERSVDGQFNSRLGKWTAEGVWAAGSKGVDDLTFVKSQFSKSQLLLPRVHFTKGYFEETVPLFARTLQNKIALLRLDGDLYSSTNVVLQCFYSHVAVGGLVIVDDYNWDPLKNGVFPCKQAVHTYRLAHGIQEPISLPPKCVAGQWWKEHDVERLGTECVENGSYESSEKIKWDAFHIGNDFRYPNSGR